MKRLSVITMLLGVLALSSPPAQAVENPTCPENLSHLGEEMDALLKGVHVKEFTHTMRSVLQASIPEGSGRRESKPMAFFGKKFNTGRVERVPTHCPHARKI